MGDPDQDDKLQQINNDILEREEEIKKRMLGDDEKALQERLKREIMKELNLGAPQDDSSLNFASLKDKLVDKIEKDPHLNQHEKDKMIYEHDRNLDQIEKDLERE